MMEMSGLFYEALSNRILEKLLKENRISKEYLEVYGYALEKLLAGLGNAILLLLTGLVFHIGIETMVFMAFYMPIRRYAGGIHASTRLRCTIISLFSVVAFIKVSSFLIIHISYWNYLSVGILILVNIIVFRYAPVDTANKRLSKENKIKYGKLSRIITIVESLLLVIGILFLPVLKLYCMTAVLAILLAGITLLPYKKIMEGLYYEERKQKV
jgi:accessory gene regulator B